MPIAFKALHLFDMTFEGQVRHFDAGSVFSTDNPCQMRNFLDAVRSATKEG
jgi:hypothetical protein